MRWSSGFEKNTRRIVIADVKANLFNTLMAASTTQTKNKRRAQSLYRKLQSLYPDAHCELDYKNPYQLLMATILSAQCTDVRVNMVTPILFKKYPTPGDLAAAKQNDVEAIIHSTGFYRNKAKSLVASSGDIASKFDGHVPNNMEDLLTLRGVARKTANVVLGNAYDIHEGVVVDTHVNRLANRMGFTKQKDPTKIERDLMQLFPRKKWMMLSHLLIWHGRRHCKARNPDCIGCPLRRSCPKIGL